MRRALIVTLLLLAAAPPATALAYDDAGYLGYADRMQERLDPLWDEASGQYRPGPGGVDALINSLMAPSLGVPIDEMTDVTSLLFVPAVAGTEVSVG